jgi:hypothetical protein
MVKDVDKSAVIDLRSTYDYQGKIMPTEYLSGGVKSLILLYKRQDILIRGSAMGNNCAKWLVEIGKRVDRYMTLGYCMDFGGRMFSKEPFECVILNNGIKVNTYTEFYDVFADMLDDPDGFKHYENIPDWIIKPKKKFSNLLTNGMI